MPADVFHSLAGRSGRSGAGSSSTRSVTVGVYKHLRDVPPDEIVREAAKAVGDGEPGSGARTAVGV